MFQVVCTNCGESIVDLSITYKFHTVCSECKSKLEEAASLLHTFEDKIKVETNVARTYSEPYCTKCGRLITEFEEYVVTKTGAVCISCYADEGVLYSFSS